MSIKINGSSSGGSAASDAYILLQNRQAAGTDGGATAAGSWLTYPVNVKQEDTGANCTLTGNDFVLAAGTYRIISRAIFRLSGLVKLRLYNVTDSAIVLVGQDGHCDSGSCNISVDGRFTVAASKTLRIQYYSQLAEGTDGLGRATGAVDASGMAEVYSDFIITKEF